MNCDHGMLIQRIYGPIDQIYGKPESLKDIEVGITTNNNYQRSITSQITTLKDRRNRTHV